jgi:putative glutamine amidotransferase
MIIAIIPDYVEEGNQDKYILRATYVQAVIRAGGIPIILPYDRERAGLYVDHCQGVLFTGGGYTIDPARFGQSYATTLPLKPKRSDTEFSFFDEAFKRKMPILGICAGAQLINVALGGTLIQHLPTTHPHALPHSHPDPTDHGHLVHVVPGTFLETLVKEPSFGVNTSHVQAIDALGRGVKVSARAPDGIIEGIEVEGHPFCVGLQWHPEYLTQPACDLLIFESFIEHAKSYGDSFPHKSKSSHLYIVDRPAASVNAQSAVSLEQ